MRQLTKRQNDIVSASIDLIAEGGMKALTMKQLAKRIGVTEPALYRHFHCKQDILLEVLRKFEHNTRRMFEIARKSGKNGLAQIEEVYIQHFRTFARRPAVAAVIFSEEVFRFDKRLSLQVNRILDATESSILQIVSNAEPGQFRTDIGAKDLTLVLMGALRLVVTRWRLSGCEFDLERKGRMLWKSLSKLVGA